MGKRKITVTVDEELVALAQRLDDDTLSGTVNAALRVHLHRLARREALRELLDTWEAEHGPVSEEAAAEARAAFDELDDITAPVEGAS